MPFTTRAHERKRRSEQMLFSRGVTINPGLPAIESEDETRLRAPAQVARRVLCLLSVAAALDGVDRNRLREWLRREGAWNDCNPEERRFLETERPDRHTSIQFGWRSECVWLLLWALHLVDDLEFPTRQCSIEEILKRVPAFDAPTREFVRSARLRPVAEVLDVSDLTYRAHWAVTHQELDAATAIGNLDAGVVVERHWAVNWLTRYDDAEWDEVATDT